MMKIFQVSVFSFLLLSVIGLPSIVIAQEGDPIDVQELTPPELGSEEGFGEVFQAPGDIETQEVKARVVEIQSDETIDGVREMIFVAEAEGESFTVDTSQSFLEGLRYNLKVGDKVYLQIIKINGEVNQAFLVDVVRLNSLIWIAILFMIVIISVGYWRGVASIFGLAVTLAVLFGFVFPFILKGSDPVLITIIGSIVILGVNMHLSHGSNKKTLLAYGATLVGLVLVYVFATLFVRFADLSGLASEEAVLLFLESGNITWPAGILLAGIILGAIGVLDDIAITQSEVVHELKEADPKLTRKELFVSAMRIGRHHIASTVNTLVLAYAGVAMPLLLLFLITQGIDTVRFINEELVAEEIVRTLAGTMALVLTVPIATWFATFVHKD